jgi:hypothetical protein
MSAVRVGIYDHFGWAVAVTVDGDGAVVDRRRLELVAPDVCPAPIHYDGKSHDLAGVTALVQQVRASVARATATALDELAASLRAPIATMALRTWSPDFPSDIETQLRSPYEARADAIMYRQILAQAAEARGWIVHRYDAKQVLGAVDDAVLHAPRAALGPPWTKDHRVALAAVLDQMGPDSSA